jgi:CheY-like chemotaxis protein
MVHVLVVDDDPDLRAVLRSVLEDYGHAVSEAGDGLRALEQLRGSHWPFVVLLDLKMPLLDGAAVLGAVAGDRSLAHRHRFVLVTGSAQTLPPALGTLLTSLDVPLVQKPFDVEALLDLVALLAQEIPPAAHATYGTSTVSVS